MKTDTMRMNWMGALFGALLVLAAGLAQAAPVCLPTYDLNGGNVTLFANCAPDPGRAIDDLTGYNWTGTSAVSATTTSEATDTDANANNRTFRVKAKHQDEAGFAAGLGVPVFVTFDSPPACSLKVLVPDAAPADSANIVVGGSAMLVPDCPGAFDYSWYAKLGSGGTYARILNPPGGVVFPPSGVSRYYVVGITYYGDTASNEVTLTSVAPLTGCAISPGSATRTVGSTQVSFSVPCSGGNITSVVWSGNGAAGGTQGTGTNIINFSTANSLGEGSYTITANVNSGAYVGNATLTVSPVVQPSSCTITPITPSIIVGATQSFTANCAVGGLPITYTWTGGGAGTTSANTSIYTTANDLTVVGSPYTIEFTASNAGGSHVTNSKASTTLSVTSVAVPACSSISGSGTVTTGSSSASLGAVCDSTPTSWYWKLNGVDISSACPTNSATCTVPAPSLPTVGGNYVVTVTANNAGGTGTTAASKTITVAPAPAPGASQCSALGYTVKTSPATALNWGMGVGKSGFLLRANEAYTLSFNFASLPAAVRAWETLYSQATKQLVVSESACGFDAPVGGQTACKVQQNQANGMAEAAPYITFGTTAAYAPYCKLNAGTTYYLNIRNSVAGTNGTNSCTSSSGCVFWLKY